MFPFNYHTHSNYCDGSSAPEDYVKIAIQKGLTALGFSSHAPLPFENHFAIKDMKSLKQYEKTINELKEKYLGSIDVFAGLEADYIPGLTYDFSHFNDDFTLDFIIGSIHLVKSPDGQLWFIDGPDSRVWEQGLEQYFDNNIKQAITAYYDQLKEMITTQRFDILGHLDKIKMHNHDKYFSVDEPWYRDLVSETLEAIRKSDLIVEVNTRGLYKKRSDSLFPGISELKLMQQMSIPIIISSDAHKPEEVNLLLDETLVTLKEIGYREIYCFESGWKSVPLD